MKKLISLFKKLPSRYWLLALVVAVAVSCVSVSGTFASFQSTVIGTGETPVAEWDFDVKINSTVADDNSRIAGISLAGDETHQNRDSLPGLTTMSAYKFAPGTAGYMPVEINGTNVAMSVLVTVRGYFVNLPEDVVFYDNLGNSLTIERDVSDFEPSQPTTGTKYTLQSGDTVSAISYQYYVSYQEINTWKEDAEDITTWDGYINIGFRWAWINNGDDDDQTDSGKIYNEVRVTGLQVTNANQLRNAKTVHFVDDTHALITDNAKVLNVLAKTIDASGVTIAPTADFYLDVNGFTTKDAVYEIEPTESVTKVVLGTNRREIDYKTAENRPTVEMDSASTLAYISNDFRYNYGTVQAKNYSAPLLVKNMNSILDDYPADTMYDALANVIAQVSNTTTYDYGTNFASLDSIGELATFIAGSSDLDNTEVLWNTVSKQFVYLQDGEEVLIYNVKTVDPSIKVNFFKAYLATTFSDIPQTYSIYLAGAVTGDLNTSVGLDVGENTGITSITYTNTGDAQDVIIRTNTFGTKLFVNGTADDTVTHYGFAGLVEVKKVAMSSYDEYGIVGRISATATDAVGHIDIKAGATVYQIEQLGGNATSVTIDATATVYDINHNKVTETIINNSERFTAIGTDSFVVTDEHATHETITASACVHDNTEDVVDDVHVYEVCKTCGYTVIKVNSDKKTVATSDNQNVIIPKAAYSSDQTTAAESDNGDVQINKESGEYVTPAIEQTSAVTPSANESSSHKHAFEETAYSAPTCVSNGTRTNTCTCGTSYTTTIYALGHDFTSGTYKDNGDGTHSQKCVRCEEYGALESCDTAGNNGACSKCGYKSMPNIVAKGAIIQIDGKSYRVLSCNGNEAKLLTMYDVIDQKAFNSNGGNLELDENNVYENSTMDTYLNNTFYNSLSFKNHIKSVNINVNGYKSYSYNDGLTDYYATEYSDVDEWNSENDYYSYIIKDATATTTINRYVYALDIQDIYDYYEKNSITSEELNAFMFGSAEKLTLIWNEEPLDTPYNVWLRSACTHVKDEWCDEDTTYVWTVISDTGSIYSTYPSDGEEYPNDSGFRYRASFVVDLSQVDYIPPQKTITWQY